jgi:hypothetical protein
MHCSQNGVPFFAACFRIAATATASRPGGNVLGAGVFGDGAGPGRGAGGCGDAGRDGRDDDGAAVGEPMKHPRSRQRIFTFPAYSSAAVQMTSRVSLMPPRTHNCAAATGYAARVAAALLASARVLKTRRLSPASLSAARAIRKERTRRSEDFGSDSNVPAVSLIHWSVAAGAPVTEHANALLRPLVVGDSPVGPESDGEIRDTAPENAA